MKHFLFATIVGNSRFSYRPPDSHFSQYLRFRDFDNRLLRRKLLHIELGELGKTEYGNEKMPVP